MKKRNAVLLIGLPVFVVIVAIAGLNSCSNEVQKEVPVQRKGFNGSVNTLPDSFNTKTAEAKMYALPTPLQVSSAIKTYGYEFNNNLLLPQNLNVNYATNFQRALNLGIHTIDLGYSTVYEYQSHGIGYLKNIKTLMTDLGIDQSSPKTLLNRFEQNSNKPDSLYQIILEVYEMGHNYFQQNGREGLGLLILTGCYIEGLHLTLGINHKNDIQYQVLIAQQKLFLENLIELLGFYFQAGEIQKLVGQLNALNQQFGQIELDYNDPTTKPFSIKGKLSKDLMDSLKIKTDNIRTEIIS